ncbi:putative tRNA (cytidine(34)-2'-O)-methyltransferase isoform X2 [Zingiber officinale]|uniref:putative tRNA (cytidine(34)-2'-O)-methyltransferase isoform X2 n=1 Tax=Zingiber officinale TaxID=94328 RepID=UPI001C4D90DC|nr:putative tRNA (cytidine(34)-2'-O)-methyltransferase isoform X2 [Zingiber officinale]
MEAAGQRALHLLRTRRLFRVSGRTPHKIASLSFHSSSSLEPFSYRVEIGHAKCCTSSANGAVSETSPNKFLQVVLVSPLIPGNTGSIARTCAASAVGLHLVGPLGYKIEDSKLKRAGLDYWPLRVSLLILIGSMDSVVVAYVLDYFTPFLILFVKVHNSWSEFHDYFKQQDGEKRLLAFTKRGTHIHSDFSYKKGDWLVFGSETTGLPPQALMDCSTECLGGGTIRIPMIDTYVRCLNLSVSVGIAVYEAARQLNYEQLQVPLLSEDASERLFSSEDIFG